MAQGDEKDTEETPPTVSSGEPDLREKLREKFQWKQRLDLKARLSPHCPLIVPDSIGEGDKRFKKGECREKVLEYLSNVEGKFTAKQITNDISRAYKIHIHYDSVKKTLQRLAKSGEVLTEKLGYYTLYGKKSEKRIEEEEKDRIIGAIQLKKGEIPRLHDIHLVGKLENVIKSGQRDNKITCLPSTFISTGTEKVVTPTPLEVRVADLFNIFHPDSIYQRWVGITEEITGGKQERLYYKENKVTVQMWGTGTIRICIENSENPFDAIGFREWLSWLDILFQSRCGYPFLSICDWFYIDQVGLSSDIRVEKYEGMQRFNVTVKHIGDWLFRVYEKQIGEDYYIRTEQHLLKGDIQDTSVSTFLAMMEGGINPAYAVYTAFRGEKQVKELAEQVQVLMRSLDKQAMVNKAVMDMIRDQSETQKSINESLNAVYKILSRLEKKEGET